MSNPGPTNGKGLLDTDDPAPLLRPRTTLAPYRPVGPLIGRGLELAQVHRCFEESGCRLVSLVGLGGIGKTRLAWEIAQQMAPAFPEGSVFVSLAPLASADLIVPALAASLGYTFRGAQSLADQLLDFLSTRKLLLVLDNFEHLLPGATVVADVLRAAPHVRLLVTSRERLNLREEWVIDVSGLNCPPDETTPGIEQYDAVQLFATCARRVKANFALTPENEADIARICRLVEGLPLAIELAASWVRVLPCRAIATEIARNLDLLTTEVRDWPEKHRSLRAVFGESWALLSTKERRALESLAVFRGGFRRDAAEAVAGADWAALSSLLDKALLHPGPDDRYDMHSLVRQYAAEQLEAAEARERLGEAHSAYFAEFVADRVEDLKGHRQLEALREISAEFENVRTAWNWGVERQDVARIGRMLDGVWLFGELRSRERECEALRVSALQRFADRQDEAALRLWGRLASRVSEATAAATEGTLRVALHIARRYDDPAEIAQCLNRLGAAAYSAGDFAAAQTLLEESVGVARTVGDPFQVARALFDLSTMGYDLPWERMSALRDESLRLSTEIGDRVGMAMSLSSKAVTAARLGHYAEAERLWRERIALAEEAGNVVAVALGYAHLSYQIYFVQGNFAAARAAADEAYRLAETHHIQDALGWSQVTLGALAAMAEDYNSALALCQRGAAAGFLVEITGYAAWGICLAAWGRRDEAAIRAYFPAALHYHTKQRGEVGYLLCLPIAAYLMEREGQPERALEWLGLAFAHPLRASGWMEQWPLLTRWRGDLERTLGAQVYRAAWQRGARLALAAVMAEVYGRWVTDDAAPSVAPTQPLAERLTPRELEVLRLLARGLSNPAIARELVISVGTVKAHTSSIYGKLGVTSRVEAVTRAKALGLA